MQVITGINAPHRAYSSGGLYHFKDGRDFPICLRHLRLPSADGGFQLHLHCNQNNADGDERLSFFGSTALWLSPVDPSLHPQNVTLSSKATAGTA